MKVFGPLFLACDDYHSDCPAWSNLGHCGTNPWMLENCRFSCQSCLSHFELRNMCRGRSGGGGGAIRRSRGRRSPLLLAPPPLSPLGVKSRKSDPANVGL